LRDIMILEGRVKSSKPLRIHHVSAEE
jgi:hypothetical protein